MNLMIKKYIENDLINGIYLKLDDTIMIKKDYTYQLSRIFSVDEILIEDIIYEENHNAVFHNLNSRDYFSDLFNKLSTDFTKVEILAFIEIIITKKLELVQYQFYEEAINMRNLETNLKSLIAKWD